MKSELVEFLKPDKKKIIVTLVFPYLFIGLALLISGLADLFRLGVSEPISEYLLASILSTNPLTILFRIIYSILTYPFICAIFVVASDYKKGSIRAIFSSRTKLYLIVLGLVFFNPFIGIFYLSIISAMVLFVSINLFYPPMLMVEIVSISPDSPFIESGLEPTYKIYSVETYNSEWIRIDERTRKEEITNHRKFRVHNSTEFLDILDRAAIGQIITITTSNGNQYSITKTKNFTNWGVEIGEAK